MPVKLFKHKFLNPCTYDLPVNCGMAFVQYLVQIHVMM